MNMQSVLLILRLVAEGVGVAQEIADLARRVLNNEEITDAEIEAAHQQMNASVDNLEKTVKDKKEAAKQE